MIDSSWPGSIVWKVTEWYLAIGGGFARESKRTFAEGVALYFICATAK
jgi:hypothetical protein